MPEYGNRPEMNEKFWKAKSWSFRFGSDAYFDMIAIEIDAGEGLEGLHLRSIVVSRFKMSGMSGDEWRHSYVWQIGGLNTEFLDLVGNEDWIDVSEGTPRLARSISSLYPLCFENETLSARILHHARCSVYRKGVLLAELSAKTPLFHLAGRLAWNLEGVRDEGLPKVGIVQREGLCHQPGCSGAAAVTLGLLHRYSDDGVKAPIWKHQPAIRQFCPRHLDRGDGALEDSNRNYYLISGEIPKIHGFHPGDESPSAVVIA